MYLNLPLKVHFFSIYISLVNRIGLGIDLMSHNDSFFGYEHGIVLAIGG